MSRVSFNVAAKCDKAGRTQNQDNYWVCPDLSRVNDSFEDVIGKDKDVALSDKGALLVVADGMGGMNAGEKASELVIKGVQKGFSSIPEGILGNDDQMLSFIRDVIVSSDQSVKDYAKTNREADGLGSTIVLLWLWGGKAYCGWCGDSRIYRYNPNNSLVRLSHDHSYVQELVDDGKIEPEEAFDHPDGNIVTRALGDNGEKANPELKVYDICERDMFLLCSDGLCGLLQDKQIEDIISVNCSSTKDALAALWKAGESEGWTDNATIDLLNIVEGGARPKGVAVGYPVIRKKVEQKPKDTSRKNTGGKEKQQTEDGIGKFFKPPFLYIYALVALLLLGFILFKTCSSRNETNNHNSGNEYTVDLPAPGGKEPINADYQSPESTQPLNPQKPSKPDRRNNPSGNNTQPSNSQTPQTPSGHQDEDNGGQQITIPIPNHTEQPTSQSVSEGYINLLSAVRQDYESVRILWGQIKTGGYMFEDESKSLESFMNNVKQLKNNPDYNRLDAKERTYIDTKLMPLAKEIGSEKKNYRVLKRAGNMNGQNEQHLQWRH